MRSSLTEADLASSDIIVNSLEKFKISIISEEGKPVEYNERKDWEHYWCFDPMEGTKEFIKKNGEFTVKCNIDT